MFPNTMAILTDHFTHCGDCGAVILVMSRDLQMSHQKKIGDAISNARLAHKCSLPHPSR